MADVNWLAKAEAKMFHCGESGAFPRLDFWEG